MSTAYDAYPYRALPIAEAHVDRLAVMAHLFGMVPAAPSHARVLELGCADGGHLVPMAQALPHARFVGVDLSKRQIDDGRRFVEPLGLENLELHQGDALDLPDDLGDFDYIVCHGLYSWIPATSQELLLAATARHLRPRGVAYVSYNTLPGWTTRGTIRTFILDHAAPTEDPRKRVAGARAMLRFLHDAADGRTPHGQLLRETCTALLGTSPQYLVHGLLAPVNAPCTLRQFVDSAAGAGLDYLGDAELGRMTGARLHATGRAKVADVPGGLVDHEQVMDVLEHRSFRQSLLVPSGTPMQRTVPWQRVESLWLVARARCVEGELTDDGAARFETSAGTRRVEDPVWKTGLATLGERWPVAMAFTAWVEAVAKTLGREPSTVRAELGRRVLPAVADRLVTLLPRSRHATAHGGAQPRATSWARRQLELGHPVTDLLHGSRHLPPALAALLARCDGQNDHAGIVHELANDPAVANVGPLEAWLPGALEALRIRALLLDGEAP